MTDDVMAQAMADAQAEANNNSAELATKVALAIELMKKQMFLEDRKEQLEKKLKECNASLNDVKEAKLPDAMTDASMGKYTLPDGSEVSIENTCYASYNAGDEDFMMQWFIDNGYYGIITPKLMMQYPKGNIFEAQLFAEALENMKSEIYKEVNRLAVLKAELHNANKAEDEENIEPAVYVTPNTLGINVKADIHWSTLRKVGREIYDREDLEAPKQFALRPVSRTKIKRNK